MSAKAKREQKARTTGPFTPSKKDIDRWVKEAGQLGFPLIVNFTCAECAKNGTFYRAVDARDLRELLTPCPISNVTFSKPPPS
ncbi:hypothetical protein A2853_03135 [Candidatus Kaiserbacteria bacterium RIFCSPHIGHO2_01_FULL_55_17]|uniref:Uncharacterized protein n=1 Tax=Candidatus Kaiserbacteria bacterium RIFCSPHIGHO2_01_FULL_55_17 TaxID=1798484 RepID=A0A1F6D984_9BACT|nr:MAG: hypothetical protein A2853_03135 [Candidatus Kaiserbacteria bacterium RIFCSPHIGHO2_01_FULL_55_17]